MAWVEGYTKASSIVKDLATILTTSEKDANNNIIPEKNWILVYPDTLDSIVDTCILKTVTTPINSKSLTMYLKIERPSPTTNFQYVQLTLSDAYTSGDSFPTTGATISPVAKWYWYKASPTGNTSSIVGTNLAIHYYGSVNNDRFAMVLEGDSTVNYNDYLISFGYCGRIKSFAEGIEDIDGNFALTVKTDGTISSSTTYGDYTANGMTDIMMYKTRTGVPYQAHSPAFITLQKVTLTNQTGFNASEWTNKYHLSPVYVAHNYRDGYRGYLDGVVALDRRNIVHKDELIVTNPDSTEDRYKYFNIMSANSFMANSPNDSYGLAIIKK